MNKITLTILALLPFSAALWMAFGEGEGPPKVMEKEKPETVEVATFAGGCFWCVEAVFDRIDGVYKTTSGYTGGHVPEPTYEQVISKDTGHAEAVRIQYDPTVVSYEELLRWFWEAHDPTTLNRQGADVGPQYRSAIFVHSPEQRQIAEQSKAAAQKHFDDPIVTEVTDAGEFYAAEGYHQDYYDNNRSAGYCRYVITPKLEKLDLAK